MPITIPRPAFKLTDSADDYHISLDRLGTFIGEMLVAAHLFEEKEPLLITIRPTLHDWFKELLGKLGPLPAPEITISYKSLKNPRRTLAKSLFYTGITQLVSCYEMYVGTLAEEIYQYNPKLLAVVERQLTSAELIALGSYEDIVESLINRATSNLLTLAYPSMVQRFNREFHVGIHHAEAPATLFEVHHLIEQRNIIIHNGGRASHLYIERMNAYKGEAILKKYEDIPINFEKFFDYLYMLSALGDYIDKKVQAKWVTTAAVEERAEATETDAI